MSRFYVTMINKGRTDDEAAIGYDGPLRTFFLQGFFDNESDFDEPELWLGTRLAEFPTMESLIEEARSRGYEVRGLKPGDVITMLAEAGQTNEPTIWERIGLIF